MIYSLKKLSKEKIDYNRSLILEAEERERCITRLSFVEIN